MEKMYGSMPGAYTESENVLRWRFTFTLKYFSVKTDTIVLFVHTYKMALYRLCTEQANDVNV